MTVRDLGEDDYDVVVVGGGPAGLSAAVECSRGGLSTLLIEKDDIYQAKKNWEGFSQEVEDFGIRKAVVREHKIDRWICGYGEKASVYDMQAVGNTKRYVIDQSKFTKIMVDKGSFEVKDHTTVKECVREGNYAKIEAKDKEGNVEKIGAKLVIDASGPTANISRKMGKFLHWDWGWISYGGLMQNADISKLDINRDVCLHIMCKAPTDWGARSCEISIYPRGDDSVDICFSFHLLKGDIKVINPIAHLEDEKEYCKSTLSKVIPYFNDHHLNGFFDPKRIEREYYGFGKESIVKEPYADNLLMAGDAAGLAPPLYSYGLESSLRSGKIAGFFAQKAIQEDNLTSSYLKGYEALLEEKGLRGIWRKIIREITIGGFVALEDEQVFNVLLMTMSEVYKKEGADEFYELVKLHNLSGGQLLEYAWILFKQYLRWGRDYFRKNGLKEQYVYNLLGYLAQRF